MNASKIVKGPDQLLIRYNRPKNERLLENFAWFPQNSLQDKFIGCLLGMAVGDILGCPLEGMSFQTIRTRYPEGVNGLLFPPFWHNWRLPGLHSDDTQQALVLLNAYRQNNHLYSTDWDSNAHFEYASGVASLFVKGLQVNKELPFGCWRGTGKGFRRSIERLSRNQEAVRWPYGFGVYSAGLGASMRVPPLGVIGKNTAEIIKMVEHISFITHTNPTAVVCACSVALACHYLSKKLPETLQPTFFLSSIIEEIARIEDELSKPEDFENIDTGNDKTSILVTPLLEEVKNLIHLSPDSALKAISLKTEELTGQKIIPTAGYAPSGIAACFYFLLNEIEDPERALLNTINAGGDTDTTGAIVGAMCGSLHGPLIYRKYLVDLLTLDMILDTGLHCLNDTKAGEIDLIETECLHTEIEELARTLYLKIY
jgi:ADP-ribosyl-[dinitrogen reductase] hydrolase